MRTFEEFVRRHLALLVGINVCGFKSELTDGTFKRGQRILTCDGDMLLVLKDMYEFITETTVELPPDTFGEAVKRMIAKDRSSYLGPAERYGDVDGKGSTQSGPEPGGGSGARGGQAGGGGVQTPPPSDSARRSAPPGSASGGAKGR